MNRCERCRCFVPVPCSVTRVASHFASERSPESYGITERPRLPRYLQEALHSIAFGWAALGLARCRQETDVLTQIDTGTTRFLRSRASRGSVAKYSDVAES